MKCFELSIVRVSSEQSDCESNGYAGVNLSYNHPHRHPYVFERHFLPRVQEFDLIIAQRWGFNKM